MAAATRRKPRPMKRLFAPLAAAQQAYDRLVVVHSGQRQRVPACLLNRRYSTEVQQRTGPHDASIRGPLTRGIGLYRVMQTEQFSGRAIEGFADGGEGAEADGSGAAVLENRQVRD